MEVLWHLLSLCKNAGTSPSLRKMSIPWSPGQFINGVETRFTGTEAF